MNVLSSITVILTIAISSVQGDCDIKLYQRCVMSYQMDIGLQLLQGFKLFCRDADYARGTMLECVTNAGCDSLIPKMKETHNLIYKLFDIIICNPDEQCSLADVMECYEVRGLLSAMDISIPNDPRDAAQFMDNLVYIIHNDTDKYCKSVKTMDYAAASRCMQNHVDTVFEKCLTPTIGQLSDIIEGYTIHNFSHVFYQQMSMVISAQQMKTAATSVCEGECSGLDDRHEKFKSCTATLMTELRKVINEEDNINDDTTCSIVQDFYDCVYTSVVGCSVLEQSIHNNVHLDAMLRKCSLAFRVVEEMVEEEVVEEEVIEKEEVVEVEKPKPDNVIEPAAVVIQSTASKTTDSTATGILLCFILLLTYL